MTDTLEMCSNSVYPPINTTERKITAIASEAILWMASELMVRFDF